MTAETALDQLRQASELLHRAQDAAANGWGATADVRRATEDVDRARAALAEEG